MSTHTAHLEIPDDVLDSARMTIDEIQVELAIHLYEQKRLSIGKARELPGLSLWPPSSEPISSCSTNERVATPPTGSA